MQLAQPAQNALVERCNRRLRDECLNENLFTTMPQARAVLATWRRDDNTIPPHSKLGGRTPPKSQANGVAGIPPDPVAIPSTTRHQCR
ncbi:MAG: transposase [Roseococcus sp.]|nr:transposase [Roseococcus sp.]